MTSVPRRPTGRGALDDDLRRTAWQIGLQTAVLLVVCLLVVGGVMYAAVVRSQDDQLRQALENAVATAGTTTGTSADPDRDGDRDRRRNEPRGGVQSAVLDSRGVVTSADLPPGLPDEALMRAVATSRVTDLRTVSLRSGSYEVLTVVRGDDVVQTVASRYEQHQERELILGALLLAGGAGLVLSTLAAAVLARRAVRPMAQALELQRRFVADAGHELRTPLTLLSTRAQLLSRRVSSRSAPEREALIARDADGIVADTAALTAVLEELLLAADVRTPLPQDPVDLGALVGAAVAAAQAGAEAAGVGLVLRPVVGPAVLDAGAPVALGRAVTALVDNAVEHARGQVQVGVRQEGRSVVVEVVDDGPGIPDEMLPRMFSRFASAPPALGGGDGRRHFGLGLALVSEIATRHGGRVTATNRPAPDTGAVLRLTLPR